MAEWNPPVSFCLSHVWKAGFIRCNQAPIIEVTPMSCTVCYRKFFPVSRIKLTKERVSANILTFDHCDKTQLTGHCTFSQHRFQHMEARKPATQAVGRGEPIGRGQACFEATLASYQPLNFSPCLHKPLQ